MKISKTILISLGFWVKIFTDQSNISMLVFDFFAQSRVMVAWEGTKWSMIVLHCQGMKWLLLENSAVALDLAQSCPNTFSVWHCNYRIMKLYADAPWKHGKWSYSTLSTWIFVHFRYALRYKMLLILTHIKA